MKEIKLLSYIFLSLLLVTSCQIDDEAQDLEKDFATTPYVVGFANDSRVTNFITDGTTQTVQIPVNLINGLNYSNNPAIDVSYFASTSSTAVEGVDYDYIDPDQRLTIEAGRDFGYINIDVYTGNINTQTPAVLVLNLADPNLGVVAQQFQTISIEFNGICLSDAGGTFDIEVVRQSNGQVYNFTNETITQIGDGEYLTESTGRFSSQAGGFDLTGAPNFAARNGFVFNENCGAITIESQPLGDTFGGNPVSGTGTVADNGDLSMTIIVGAEDTYEVQYTKL